MGIISDGSYGIEKGLVYSFPVRIDKNRAISIVQGLPVNDWARGLMDATAQELIEERNDALETVGKWLTGSTTALSSSPSKL